MSELHTVSFERMMRDKHFRTNILTIVEHLEQPAAAPDETHQNCAGFYVQEDHRGSISSAVFYRHEAAAVRGRKFGHIPTTDWGSVDAYVTGSQSLIPTTTDLADLAKLTQENPWPVRGIVTPTVFSGPNFLFLRARQQGGFNLSKLADWDERQDLKTAVEVLAAAGLNSYVKGVAASAVSNPLTSRLFSG